MKLDSVSVAILAELARRRPLHNSGKRDEVAACAERLRAIFYPKQSAFFRSKARFRATRKTRRAGATTGGCRELLARAIEQMGFRASVVHTTMAEARDRAWHSDTKTGLVDVLEQFGTPVEHPSLAAYSLGGVKVFVHDQDSYLEFENGSEIELAGMDNQRSLRKLRGTAKHVIWIDEAQDFTWLETFFDRVVLAQQDFKVECWISGTPGVDCAGMFYEITKQPDLNDGPPLAGWEVHEFAQVDNPFFGSVAKNDDGTFGVVDNHGAREGACETIEVAEALAAKVRWRNTGEDALKTRGWKGDEPDFIREFFGRWVREDARYVYPVHVRPRHDIIYAPERRIANPFWKTHERFKDHPQWFDVNKAISDLPKLPKFNKRRQWMYAIGVDFGYNPDPFAMVCWAFAHDTQDVFELLSWKCPRVHTDDQGAYMKLLWDALPNVVVFVGDPAGKLDDFEVWRTRMNLPIDEANKKGKNTLEEFLADDVRRGRIFLRGDRSEPKGSKDSALYDEMKHLVYLPGKLGKTREAAKHRRSADGVVHGDHCCDAARYAYADLTHYISKAPKIEPDPKSPEGLKKEEEIIERRIERKDEAARAEELARRDEEATDYGDYRDGYDVDDYF